MSDHGAPDKPPVAERLRRHSLTRIIVLEDLQVMFLPIPKSGCTSMLWMLADLAGLERRAFQRSRISEISRSMAVHDTSLWDPRHRWMSHTEAEQRAIQSDPAWLRFAIVRDPAPRLWSAWQSKLLLQEPRFVRRFAGQEWYPRSVTTIEETVEAFRRFVRALDAPDDEAPHDAHWGSQTLLMDAFDIGFIGHSERISDTVDRLARHVGHRATIKTDVPRENAAPIRYHPSVYDDESAAIANRLFADDVERLEYQPLTDDRRAGAADWRAASHERLPMVHDLVERHLRIGELLDELAEAERRRKRRAAQLEGQIRDLREASLLAQQRIDDMERSRSWRITRPLRGLRRSG